MDSANSSACWAKKARSGMKKTLFVDTVVEVVQSSSQFAKVSARQHRNVFANIIRLVIYVDNNLMRFLLVL